MLDNAIKVCFDDGPKMKGLIVDQNAVRCECLGVKRDKTLGYVSEWACTLKRTNQTMIKLLPLPVYLASLSVNSKEFKNG